MTDGRKKDHKNVLLIKSGQEPLRFTSHFTAWTPTPIEKDGTCEYATTYLSKFKTKYSYEDLISKNFPCMLTEFYKESPFMPNLLIL